MLASNFLDNLAYCSIEIGNGYLIAAATRAQLKPPGCEPGNVRRGSVSMLAALILIELVRRDALDAVAAPNRVATRTLPQTATHKLEIKKLCVAQGDRP
jgi:hypothetical protein